MLWIRLLHLANKSLNFRKTTSNFLKYAWCTIWDVLTLKHCLSKVLISRVSCILSGNQICEV